MKKKKIREFLIENKVTIQKGIGSYFDFMVGVGKERWKICLAFILFYAILHLCSVYPDAEISKFMMRDYQSAFPLNHENIYALFHICMYLYFAVAGCKYMTRAVLKHSWCNLLELICGQIFVQVDLTLSADSIFDLIVNALIFYLINYYLAVIYFKITKVPSRRIGKNRIVNFCYEYFYAKEGENPNKCSRSLRWNIYEIQYKTSMSELKEVYKDVYIKKNENYINSQKENTKEK